MSTPQTVAGAPACRRVSNQQQPSSQHLDPAGAQQLGAPVTTTTAVQTTGSGNVRTVAVNGAACGNGARSVSKRTKASSRRKSTDRTTRCVHIMNLHFGHFRTLLQPWANFLKILGSNPR
jgi:hypothetical protein